MSAVRTDAPPISYVRDAAAPDGAWPVAARAGDLVFVGGQMPVHPVTGVPAETRLHKGMPFHGSLIEKQLRYLYDKLDGQLQQAGTSLKSIAKINSYHAHDEDIDMALRLRRQWFDHDDPPPSTLVSVSELTARDARVMIDLINVAADAARPLSGVALSGQTAISQVKQIGWAVFSQVLKGGGLVFTRGATAHNESGPVPEVMPDRPFPYAFDMVQFQLRHELNRLKGLIKDAGCTLADVVRAELHMTDMTDLAAVDEVWAEYFPVDPPARVIVPVKLPVLPMRIETELIAIDPQGPFKKETIHTEDAPTPLGPVPQAVKAGPYVFLSGQMASDYRNGLAPQACIDPNLPFHASGAKLQAAYILNNVDAICSAAGTTTANLVKRRIHHVDLDELPRAEAIWRGRFGGRLPPTSVLPTAGPLPVPDCTIQYDLIGYAPD